MNTSRLAMVNFAVRSGLKTITVSEDRWFLQEAYCVRLTYHVFTRAQLDFVVAVDCYLTEHHVTALKQVNSQIIEAFLTSRPREHAR